METIKLTKVSIVENKSDGSPLVNKNGEKYKMAVIEYVLNNETGKASMYIGKYSDKDLAVIKEWKTGDEVIVIIEQSGEYTNFKLPSKTDILEERIAKLEKTVDKIVTWLKEKSK